MDQRNYTSEILGVSTSPGTAEVPRPQLDSIYSAVGKGKKSKEYKKLKKEYKMLAKAYKVLKDEHQMLWIAFCQLQAQQALQAQPPVIAVDPTRKDGTWWKDTLSRSIPNVIGFATACVKQLPAKRPSPLALPDGHNHQ